MPHSYRYVPWNCPIDNKYGIPVSMMPFHAVHKRLASDPVWQQLRAIPDDQLTSQHRYIYMLLEL